MTLERSLIPKGHALGNRRGEVDSLSQFGFAEFGSRPRRGCGYPPLLVQQCGFELGRGSRNKMS